MANLSEKLVSILKAVAQFLGVAKYHGSMPRKHTLAYDDKDLNLLAEQGLLERVTFTYGCGQEVQGLRITPRGEISLDQCQSGRPSEECCPDLAIEHLLILQDLYHFSRMPRYHRMMPEKKARHYSPTDFEDLLNRGYILKMKLKAQGQRAMKGYVISGKGERSLEKAGML